MAAPRIHLSVKCSKYCRSDTLPIQESEDREETGSRNAGSVVPGAWEPGERRWEVVLFFAKRRYSIRSRSPATGQARKSLQRQENIRDERDMEGKWPCPQVQAQQHQVLHQRPGLPTFTFHALVMHILHHGKSLSLSVPTAPQAYK